MQNIIVIEPDTEAYKVIAAAIEQGRKISLHQHVTGLQIKRGEGTWTTPLKQRKDRPSRGEPCGHPDCLCS